MATKLKIAKGATVKVIAGADRGKSGSVLEVNASKLQVKVQGVRLQSHFDKKDGMKTLEGFIHYSNVKLVESAKKDKKSKASRKA